MKCQNQVKQLDCSEVLEAHERLKPLNQMVSLEEDLKIKTGARKLFKVPDSETIYVDQEGDVFSVKVYKLKIVDDEYGYKKVHCRDGNKKHHTIHRMIAKTFLQNPFNNNEVRHMDGKKENNHPLNLRWGTRPENIADKIRHRTYYKGGKALKLDSQMVREIRLKASQGMSFKSLARKYGVSANHIGNIVVYKKWKWLK